MAFQLISFWDDFNFMGEDIRLVIEDSRSCSQILLTFNSTFITFIPKSGKPSSFEQYWPISLCNCIYKVIASRLKPFLFNTISVSEEQFEFLEERQIHEAVGVSQEGLNTIKSKNSKPW